MHPLGLAQLHWCTISHSYLLTVYFEYLWWTPDDQVLKRTSEVWTHVHSSGQWWCCCSSPSSAVYFYMGASERNPWAILLFHLALQLTLSLDIFVWSLQTTKRNCFTNGEKYMVSLCLEWISISVLTNSLGDVMHIHFLGQSVVVLNSAKAAVDLLDKRSANYSDRPHFALLEMFDWSPSWGVYSDWSRFRMGWTSTITFMPYGKRFQRHRRMLQQYLTPNKCLDYQSIQSREARVLLQSLLDDGDNLDTYLRRCTFFSYLGHDSCSYTSQLGLPQPSLYASPLGTKSHQTMIPMSRFLKTPDMLWAMLVLLVAPPLIFSHGVSISVRNDMTLSSLRFAPSPTSSFLVSWNLLC